jgi:hypothetical protein
MYRKTTKKNKDLKNVAAGMKLILIENISLSPF